MDNRLRKIENALIGMGIEPSMRGFYYIVEAVVGKIVNPKRQMKEIYDQIAKEDGITSGSVHKIVTRTVSLADIRTDTYHRYIGSTFKTNNGFVSLLAFNIRRELEDEQDNVSRATKKRTDI